MIALVAGFLRAIANGLEAEKQPNAAEVHVHIDTTQIAEAVAALGHIERHDSARRSELLRMLRR